MLYIERKTKNAGFTQVGRINKEKAKGTPSTKKEEDSCKKTQ